MIQFLHPYPSLNLKMNQQKRLNFKIKPRIIVFKIYKEKNCFLGQFFVCSSTFFSRNEIYISQLIFLLLYIGKSVYVRDQFVLTKILHIYVLAVQVFQFHQKGFEWCLSEVHLFYSVFSYLFYANTNNPPKIRQRIYTSLFD